jgi:hypothetical protein
MAKQFVNQHIVPKRYLDRFASKVDGKYIIGTRYYEKKQPKLFRASTADVGYIKNFYDVTDRDDPKYWEHFFAREIDSLCGREMDNLISTITLSQYDVPVLSEHYKQVLSKVTVAQMMRVPSSVAYIKEIYPRIEKAVKDSVIAAIPDSLMAKYKPKIQNIKLDEQWQKEQFFNHSFAPENFDRYCSLMQDRIWVVYVNTQRDNMPFATSDNPVLVEGVGKKELGLFHNGLANPSTCIFYPISPTIAVASYSRAGIMSVVADELDGRKFFLGELKYIMDKNIKIMEQAHHHSFIPQPLFDAIANSN